MASKKSITTTTVRELHVKVGSYGLEDVRAVRTLTDGVVTAEVFETAQVRDVDRDVLEETIPDMIATLTSESSGLNDPKLVFTTEPINDYYPEDGDQPVLKIRGWIPADARAIKAFVDREGVIDRAIAREAAQEAKRVAKEKLAKKTAAAKRKAAEEKRIAKRVAEEVASIKMSAGA